MSKIITDQISPRNGDSVTVNGSISVGGTITYEDVTNVDSVGIITARSGINCVGVVTATTVSATTVTATNYVGVPEGTNILKAMLFS